jgi:hypothetical protein
MMVAGTGIRRRFHIVVAATFCGERRRGRLLPILQSRWFEDDARSKTADRPIQRELSHARATLRPIFHNPMTVALLSEPGSGPRRG